MTEHLKKLVGGLVVALLSAAVTYFLSPSADNATKLKAASIVGGAIFAVLALTMLAVALWPRVHDWAAKTYAVFLFDGLKLALKATAASEAAHDESRLPVFLNDPALLNWLSDKLLVAQNRYAFSITCIVFRSASGRIEFLAVRRPFHGFKNPVYLPPGGRFRGVDGNLLDSIRNLILKETGVDTTIISEHPKTHDLLRSVASDGSNMHNDVYAPPLFVMQQNRTQVSRVPGHLDLIYAGTIADATASALKAEIQWIALDNFKDFGEEALWPDTRECVLRAKASYEAHLSRLQGSPGTH